ncbi:MAG: DUF4230 domain-containing protein [Bacteroidota bacterium]
MFTIKILKKLLYLILLAGIILAGGYFLYQKKLWDFSFGKELKIDDTAIVIKEIKKISQLFASVYYDELVLDTVKMASKGTAYRLKDWIQIPDPSRITRPEDVINKLHFVVIARGEIMAGFDFSRIEDHHMTLENDEITFVLPPAEILEVIINPSDYEIFIEEGNWSLDEAVALKKKAAKKMTQRAIERGILEESEKKAILVLENYFSLLGFENVTIKTTPAGDSEQRWVSPSLE